MKRTDAQMRRMEAFLGPCYRSLPGAVCDVIGDAATEEEEEAIGWTLPSNGSFARSPPDDGNIHPMASFSSVGSSIADHVAHDTKEGSIARAQEGINSSFAVVFAFAIPFAFAYLRTVMRTGKHMGHIQWFCSALLESWVFGCLSCIF